MYHYPCISDANSLHVKKLSNNDYIQLKYKKELKWKKNKDHLFILNFFFFLKALIFFYKDIEEN